LQGPLVKSRGGYLPIGLQLAGRRPAHDDLAQGPRFDAYGPIGQYAAIGAAGSEDRGTPSWVPSAEIAVDRISLHLRNGVKRKSALILDIPSCGRRDVEWRNDAHDIDKPLLQQGKIMRINGACDQGLLRGLA